MVVSRMKQETMTMEIDSEMSDQDYLIHRSNTALKQGEVWESKSWMLTARALFPNNFEIQFEAFLSEKKNGNVKDCARNLTNLFDKFPKEEKLVAEVQKVMKILRSPDKDAVEGEDKLYLDMFESLSDDVQKKLIICAAERAESTLEQCNLMLVLVKRFKEEMSNHGEKLIQSINEAETRDSESKHQLRALLVTEVLPTVLNHDKVKINSKVLLSNLSKAQEFILGNNCLGSKGGGNRTDQGWSLLYNLTHCVARILGWPAVPYVATDAATIPIDQYLNILSSSPTPMFQVLSCLVLHTVSEYTKLSRDTIMVEAWVTHDSSTQDREKIKRRKTQDDPSSSLPVLSHEHEDSGSQSPLVTMFQQAVSAWSLVTAHNSLETQFHNLMSQLDTDIGSAAVSMLDSFQVDYKHYYNNVRGDVMSLVQRSDRAAWQALKTASLQYCSGDQRSAAQSLVSCVTMLPPGDNDTADTAAAGLAVPTSRPRHCRFIPLTRAAVLTYACRMLTSLLQEKALFPGAGGDMAMGHCMVLLQFNWATNPDNRELFFHLLNRVRGKDGFSYPLFCRYIINIEMLEEMMFLASEAGGGVAMDIVPGVSGGGAARPGTRGANRGEREEFKAAMRRQAMRSHENIENIIVEFLSSETSLILQTLA